MSLVSLGGGLDYLAAEEWACGLAACVLCTESRASCCWCDVTVTLRVVLLQGCIPSGPAHIVASQHLRQCGESVGLVMADC
jgi:hypothetical protein